MAGSSAIALSSVEWSALAEHSAWLLGLRSAMAWTANHGVTEDNTHIKHTAAQPAEHTTQEIHKVRVRLRQ